MSGKTAWDGERARSLIDARRGEPGAMQIRRTNHFSEWRERDREEEISLRRIAEAHAHAAE